MNNQFRQNNGHKFTKWNGSIKDTSHSNQKDTNKKTGDEDLIIEENTIYEIDRACAERLKKIRKR